MQKKLIALAVAGLVSGGAFAQSNVTIYGVADAEFASVSANGATANAAPGANTEANVASRTRVQSNSTYIGFKGTEDLGSGLKAMFQIESQIALDQATNASAAVPANTFATRDSYIGVSGNFGTAVLGYLSTPYRLLGAKFDVMPGATGTVGHNGLIGHINVGSSLGVTAAGVAVAPAAAGTTVNTLTAAGQNINTIGRTQAIAYMSPSFSGFSGMLAYVPNENKAADTANPAATTYFANPSAWNVRVDYDNGPLNIGYSYLSANDPLGTGAGAGAFISSGAAGTGAFVGSSDLTSQLFAIGYTFMGNLRFNLMWNQNKITANYVGPAVPTAGASEVKNTVWGINGKYSMGPHDFSGAYYNANDGTVSNAGTAIQNSGDRGAHQWALRYGYNFSKRTQLYVQYTEIKNDSNGNYDFGAGTNASQSQTAALGAGAGADPQSFGVGLRHSF